MQTTAETITPNAIENATSQPQFLVPIIIGLAIAVAVQLLLTHLAAAVGLSAAGDLSDQDEKSGETPSYTFYARVQRVNHMLGAWGLASASLAVFLGAWLATETSLSIDPTSGVVIGLAIWAVFYCAAMYLEATLVGSMMRRAGSAITTAAGSVSSVFTKSSKSTAADQAAAIAASVKEELFEDRRVKNIGRDLGSTLEQLERNSDPRKLRKELEILVGRTDVEFDASVDEQGEVEGVSASLHTRSLPSRDSVKAAGGAAGKAASIIGDEYSNDSRVSDSVARSILRAAGLSTDDANKHLGRFEDYLRTADEDVLDPDQIKDELELLFEDPKAALAALKTRFSSADRSTYEGLLTARGIQAEHAESIVERISGIIDSAWPTPKKDRASSSNMKERALGRVRAFLDDVDDRRLDGEAVERECELLFDDPKAGYDALIGRMKTLDREAIKAVLASRPGRDEAEAEALLQRIESARDRVTSRAEIARDKILAKSAKAKQSALEAAEGTRRIATTAAWWAFGAAVCSAASAAAGGYLAVATSSI